MIHFYCFSLILYSTIKFLSQQQAVKDYTFETSILRRHEILKFYEHLINGCHPYFDVIHVIPWSKVWKRIWVIWVIATGSLFLPSFIYNKSISCFSAIKLFKAIRVKVRWHMTVVAFSECRKTKLLYWGAEKGRLKSTSCFISAFFFRIQPYQGYISVSQRLERF